MNTEKYSISRIDSRKYPVVKNIKKKLVDFDRKLLKKNFDDTETIFHKGLLLCERLRVLAIKNEDEYCANCSLLLKINFSMIRDVSLFWKLCEDFDYNEAWIHLQNAIGQSDFTLKYLTEDSSKEIEELSSYLRIIEKLFPYHLFFSTCIEDVEVKCSICNRSPFDPNCRHLVGHIYSGKIASHIVVKMGNPNHILLCSEPEDKRCIPIIKYDRNHPDLSPFSQVYQFVKISSRPLRHFSYKISEKDVSKSTLSNYPSIAPCPCGSGEPFEECCNRKDTIKIKHYDFCFL